jgi:hypothetical protein
VGSNNVGFLSKEKAAEILSDELGRPVRAWMVEHAIRQGRLQAERGPGRRAAYLIPEEELHRLVEEIHEKRAGEAQQEGTWVAEGKFADAWDYLPEHPMESFWIGDWKRWMRWSRPRQSGPR